MRRTLQGLALLVLVLATGLPVAWSTFLGSERELGIGAHQAVVSPTFDGHATIDPGPLLPRARLPVSAPLGSGAHIRLGDAEVASLQQLVRRDAVIASQPEGEVRAVRAAVLDMARDAALRGLGVGLLAAVGAVVAWRVAGPARRREVAAAVRHPRRGQVVAATGTAAVVLVALALVVLPRGSDDGPARTWAPVREVFPELPADPVLDRLELAEGGATTGSRALVEGALYLYRDSVSFYGALEEQAQQVRLRTPQEGESTALVVTDRHDNIGMDPVVRRIADQAGARMLIDLGDDTSQGGSWEAFSLNSLAREFEGFATVAVGGNHDSGETVEQMARSGFTVLRGEPVEVGGVRFLGESDPRGTTLTGYTEDAATREGQQVAQDAALAETACEADERGERVAVLAVHSWASAKQVAASGCVDLVLTGHLHYQVGPKAIETADGTPTARLGTGSTGGAVLPIALGSSLRRDAQASIVTFDAEGVPVGVQVVTFTPAGVIDVSDHVRLPLPTSGAEQADDPDEPDDPQGEETTGPPVG